MTADFVLVTLPQCQLTPERAAQLRAVIDELQWTAFASVYDHHDCGPDPGQHATKQLRQLLWQAVQQSQQAHTREDVLQLHLASMDHMVLVAGGQTMGNPPSNGYVLLNWPSKFDEVVQLLRQFSREDLASQLAPSWPSLLARVAEAAPSLLNYEADPQLLRSLLADAAQCAPPDVLQALAACLLLVHNIYQRNQEA